MLGPEEKESLILRIARGDESANSEFRSSYSERLLRFALRKRVPVQDAEDLVQDVVLAAIQGIKDEKFRGQSALGTWLTGILQNKIADYWRSAGKSRERLVSLNNREGPSVVGGQLAPQAMDAVVQLHKALDQLPEEHRVILLLNLTEGLTTEEIARVLKRKAGTIGRILANAKERLRIVLSDSDADLRALPPVDPKNSPGGDD